MGTLVVAHLPLDARAADAPTEARVERRLGAMGTWLQVEVEAADRPAALLASEAAVRAIETTEARLSTWRTESELVAVNRNPARSQDLSRELADELGRALRCAEATGGAFDPTVAALVDAWNLRGTGRVLTRAALRRALAKVGHRDVAVRGTTLERGRADLAFEEGGFGKGAALDAAVAALRTAGVAQGSVDLGGQIAWVGADRTVAIAHPGARDVVAVTVTLPAGSVSTSGNSERGKTIGGVRWGHLLDPRTGKPAADFGSVTVWAPTALEADCLSTGLYVLGPEAALAFARHHKDIHVLVLDTRGPRLVVRASEGLQHAVRSEEDSRP